MIYVILYIYGVYIYMLYIYDIHIIYIYLWYIYNIIYIYIVQMERGSIIPRIYILGLHICYFTYCINSQFLFLARAPRSFHGSKKKSDMESSHLQYLVGGTPIPLWKLWKSVGIILLNIWNISQWEGLSQYMESHKFHVPNHQPDMVWNTVCGL